MAAIERDVGYRTALGVAFYDRGAELGRLAELLRLRRTLVIYGPRNVGKSELARYFLLRRAAQLLGRVNVVAVDVRRLTARDMGLLVVGLEEALDAIGKIVRGVSSFSALVLDIAKLIAEIYKRLSARLTVVLVDEFHLLHSSAGEAVRELEKVAGYLAKHEAARLRLIITVSEGFAASSDVRRRLYGYSVGYMLVEPLDKTHMEGVYREYVSVAGCRLSFNAYWSVFGGAPGYLADACSFSEDRLTGEYIPQLITDILDFGLERLSTELGFKLGESMRMALRLFESSRTGETGETPAGMVFAEKLVEYNIAYPCRTTKGTFYLPQLPVYAAALQEAVSHGYERVTEVPAERLLELGGDWAGLRCSIIAEKLRARPLD